MDKCLKCGGKIQDMGIYGLHPPCYRHWFQLAPHSGKEFAKLDPKKDGFSNGPISIGKHKDSFYHGRYLKYTAKLDRTKYILKVQEDEYPDLPAMEYLCNSIASTLSLPIPPYFFINFSNRPTFVTRNFMDSYPAGVLHHLYKFLPEGTEHYNCQEIIKTIFQETEKWLYVVQFAQICLFDSFVGNNDRHGRNLGIIESPKGKCLAPFYDNPSFFGTVSDDMLDADIRPSGSIWTSTSKEPQFGDYLEEFHREGLDEICRKFSNKINNKFKDIISKVEHSHISAKRKRAFCRFLEKTMDEVDNG